MNLSEINWDINVSGTWPAPVKAAVTGIVCLLMAGGWFYLDTLNQIDEFKAETEKETSLRQTFERKQIKALNLQDYEIQLTQIEAELFEMIRQMPTREEVASLLTDISQMGLANGLEFRLFKIQPAVQKDFYSELPINIEVFGKYDQLGVFVSGLAALPRIVTVHDVNITPVVDGEAKHKKETQLPTVERLLMSATIKTYNESQTPSPGKADITKGKRVGK